jgi:cytochrome P450
LLFAGHKNPAIGAAQSYLLLQEYGSEEVRTKCRKEAALLVSTTIPIKWSQFKSSLPTLHRACLESLRLTAHSIGGIRTAQKDLTVLVNSGTDMNDYIKETVYRIPKGASVGFAHITSSLDTSIWGENAGVFDSDLRRYSEESYTDDYKFTTFSHGVHKCPGRELAMIHLKITVALLLTEYEVRLPERIPPLDFERATLAQREGAVMVSITQRQRQQK